MTEAATALCILFILLSPFAIAGLALINSGLIRSRSAAHSMMAALCAVAIAAGMYFVCGFAVAGYSGGPAHACGLQAGRGTG